jgi:hypothetical protein
MARIIRAELRRARLGGPTPPPRTAVLARYERRRLTRELAGVFDGLLAAQVEAPVAAIA